MFRTEVQVHHSPITINLSDKIVTAGSCFSDTIGNQLLQNKFDALVNPFGTNYNPHSIHKCLRYALHNQIVSDHTYLENQGIISNYDFHSAFSAMQKKEIEKKIKETIGATHYFLKDTRWIFITYGTAWIYERKDTGDIVANCHKVASSNFKKVLLNQNTILESFDEFHKDLKTYRPECKIIITVSPVRHIKDTLALNSVSKSVLRLACQTIEENFSDVFYFPSFEIMMDDLRDYRFYKSDLLHPSEEAEDYIWRKFAASFFDESTQDFIKQWKPIQTALQHKPFHPTSAAHQNFLKTTLSQLESLKNKVSVEKEILFVKSQLLTDE
jgi:hypothetical protein